MPTDQWRPGHPIRDGTPEADWMDKGVALLNSRSFPNTTYSGRLQALLNDPQWAPEFDQEIRTELAYQTLSYAERLRYPRRQLPPLSLLHDDGTKE